MSPLDRTALIAYLERHPDQLQLYAKTLESAIADLMDETFRATDPMEKARLAMLEMRARLVMEAWLKIGVN